MNLLLMSFDNETENFEYTEHLLFTVVYHDYLFATMGNLLIFFALKMLILSVNALERFKVIKIVCATVA